MKLKKLNILKESFPNSDHMAMLETLGDEENWAKGFHVGRTWQAGQHALVVALSGGAGKRCIKIMARLPPGLVLTDAGLRILYNAWLNSTMSACATPAALSEDRVRTIIFAAALEGDATSDLEKSLDLGEIQP